MLLPPSSSLPYFILCAALHRDYCQHHPTLSAGRQFYGQKESFFLCYLLCAQFFSLSRVLVTASWLQAPLGRGSPGGPARSSHMASIHILYRSFMLSRLAYLHRVTVDFPTGLVVHHPSLPLLDHSEAGCKPLPGGPT